MIMELGLKSAVWSMRIFPSLLPPHLDPPSTRPYCGHSPPLVSLVVFIPHRSTSSTPTSPYPSPSSSSLHTPISRPHHHPLRTRPAINSPHHTPPPPHPSPLSTTLNATAAPSPQPPKTSAPHHSSRNPPPSRSLPNYRRRLCRHERRRRSDSLLRVCWRRG